MLVQLHVFTQNLLTWELNFFNIYFFKNHFICTQVKLDQLEEFYSSLGGAVLAEEEPKVGLPCVTRFSEDGRFYRAQITAIHGKSANVVFVDYGNEEETPLAQLRRIVPVFTEFPRLVSRLYSWS